MLQKYYGGFFHFYKVLYSTLLHLRLSGSEDARIKPRTIRQSDAPTTRIDLMQKNLNTNENGMGGCDGAGVGLCSLSTYFTVQLARVFIVHMFNDDLSVSLFLGNYLHEHQEF